MPAVVEDELPREQTPLAPAVDGLRRNVEPGGQFLDRMHLLTRLGDRQGQPAAELGDEDLQVVQQVATGNDLRLQVALGPKAGDMEADEVVGVLPVLLDQGVEPLRRLKLRTPLHLRREPKLHQQLCQVGTLDLSHITRCPFYRQGHPKPSPIRPLPAGAPSRASVPVRRALACRKGTCHEKAIRLPSIGFVSTETSSCRVGLAPPSSSASRPIGFVWRAAPRSDRYRARPRWRSTRHAAGYWLCLIHSLPDGCHGHFWRRPIRGPAGNWLRLYRDIIL